MSGSDNLEEEGGSGSGQRVTLSPDDGGDVHEEKTALHIYDRKFDSVRRCDLAPIQNVLLELAISLQIKVSDEVGIMANVKERLAVRMMAVASSLEALSDIKLPSDISLPAMLAPSSAASDVTGGGPSEVLPSTSKEVTATGSQNVSRALPADSQDGAQARVNADEEVHPGLSTIRNIYKYRDLCVKLLHHKAEQFQVSNKLVPPTPMDPESSDFSTASDEIDKSFHFLRCRLEEIGKCTREIERMSTDTVGNDNSLTLRKFNSDMCGKIDNLERHYVMEKMGEMTLRTCSLQSRKPVKSIGFTLDFQEIMSIAKSTKAMVYEISLQMLKLVDKMREQEMACTAIYHALTKENSELLRRYCIYLKLKIQQL